ncbi:ABC-2 type transport system ATP-binding protein [Anaerobranca californiensis DSM 14826]|jgi:ABC-2 type transport system ATP-binding protein|uniref:ABC-2 type transport system ATP-binding protein n=1 Tax=Anaerobranca californiensis DSM 14826 TaxID=1120989 RepID=A0A1M6LEB9_9FIRM|nr:ABC transporter ATP-binding protein [Anaerobranca californiensis]SHJ69553.1 ABC-2 type transport system ATP-binding protein [Anaerobranca californiensis DSM 14826]
MIEVKGLIKKYGDFEVIKSIDFTVKKGSVFGFLGKNGAGKTTTMNILTGLINYNSGKITIDGLDFPENKNQILRKIGYLPENPVFYDYMTGEEYLYFIAGVSGIPQMSIKSRVEELLHQVKLTDAKDRRVGGYSRGMKQRLGLAVALFNYPQYLFLDEPTSALDPQGRLEILDLITELKDNKTTVFLSTHILSDVERVCDEVCILDKGKILLTSSLEDLQNKYIQRIFDITFENDCSSIVEKLKNLPYVEKVVQQKRSLSIYAKDLEKAKRELLNELVKLDNPIVNYQIRQGNLEDIFIRLVNNNDIL